MHTNSNPNKHTRTHQTSPDANLHLSRIGYKEANESQEHRIPFFAFFFLSPSPFAFALTVSIHLPTHMFF